MIVGVSEINEGALVAHSKTAEEFREYSDSLVPKEFRHNQAIMDNQAYLCCLVFRKVKGVSWDKKKEIVNQVLKKVCVVGFTDTLIDASVLLNIVDIKRVNSFKERGL